MSPSERENDAAETLERPRPHSVSAKPILKTTKEGAIVKRLQNTSLKRGKKNNMPRRRSLSMSQEIENASRDRDTESSGETHVEPFKHFEISQEEWQAAQDQISHLTETIEVLVHQMKTMQSAMKRIEAKMGSSNLGDLSPGSKPTLLSVEMPNIPTATREVDPLKVSSEYKPTKPGSLQISLGDVERLSGGPDIRINRDLEEYSVLSYVIGLSARVDKGEDPDNNTV